MQGINQNSFEPLQSPTASEPSISPDPRTSSPEAREVTVNYTIAFGEDQSTIPHRPSDSTTPPSQPSTTMEDQPGVPTPSQAGMATTPLETTTALQATTNNPASKPHEEAPNLGRQQVLDPPLTTPPHDQPSLAMATPNQETATPKRDESWWEAVPESLQEAFDEMEEQMETIQAPEPTPVDYFVAVIRAILQPTTAALALKIATETWTNHYPPTWEEMATMDRSAHKAVAAFIRGLIFNTHLLQTLAPTLEATDTDRFFEDALACAIAILLPRYVVDIYKTIGRKPVLPYDGSIDLTGFRRLAMKVVDTHKASIRPVHSHLKTKLALQAQSLTQSFVQGVQSILASRSSATHQVMSPPTPASSDSPQASRASPDPSIPDPPRPTTRTSDPSRTTVRTIPGTYGPTVVVAPARPPTPHVPSPSLPGTSAPAFASSQWGGNRVRPMNMAGEPPTPPPSAHASTPGTPALVISEPTPDPSQPTVRTPIMDPAGNGHRTSPPTVTWRGTHRIRGTIVDPSAPVHGRWGGNTEHPKVPARPTNRPPPHHPPGGPPGRPPEPNGNDYPGRGPPRPSYSPHPGPVAIPIQTRTLAIPLPTRVSPTTKDLTPNLMHRPTRRYVTQLVTKTGGAAPSAPPTLKVLAMSLTPIMSHAMPLLQKTSAK